MSDVIGFDIYGTLIDTHGVVDGLEEMIGDKAKAFSQAWRDKQLEYSFRRGLMQSYEDFAVCTRQALDYTDQLFDAQLTGNQKQELLDIYKVLPAFDDVEDALQELNQSDVTIYAFSNGSAEAVEALLDHAGVRSYFQDIISVDEIHSFKPDPAVYNHFLQRTCAQANHAWLVSSNSFDVLGANAVGMQTAWVRRTDKSMLDPWDIEPTITIAGLHELATIITNTERTAE